MILVALAGMRLVDVVYFANPGEHPFMAELKADNERPGRLFARSLPDKPNFNLFPIVQMAFACFMHLTGWLRDELPGPLRVCVDIRSLVS
jgi:hypothetical protein